MSSSPRLLVWMSMVVYMNPPTKNNMGPPIVVPKLEEVEEAQGQLELLQL